jgi:predicted phosphodiesterase
MLNDFTLIQRHFPHNRELHIHPIADVHLGAAEHMESAWREFRTRILEDPDAYIILDGDLINNATRSSVSNIFEETMRPREQKKLMTEMLEPLRDKILCAVPGNHEGRSGKDADDDPMYDIMCKLDLEDIYRENMAFVKIQCGSVEADGRLNPTYVIAVTHGNGNGLLTGGSVNRAERFGYAIDGADVLILGHTHKPFTTQPGKIFVDSRNNRVSVKPFKVVSATSWLSYGGYAARKNLLPTTHAPQILKLSGNRKEIKIEM